ncbi:MAG: beta-lactamase family protein [Chloroflexi bacterium]|nr:beta-lactamase family protein [Chloroflexota bacterium]
MTGSSAEFSLPRATPESQGIASPVVRQFVEALENQGNVHSVMLLRHGKVIAEGWWSPYARDYPHMLFSVSKSFTSTAVGLAAAEGYLSIDDRVLSYFPAETSSDPGDPLAAMTVRHLLTMSTGHAVDTWPTMVRRPDGDWVAGFLEVPVTRTPGTHFVYNTGATYMLSAIVQKATGMKLTEFLQPRLFAPLGIENATWRESPRGIAHGGTGLSVTTEDIAKFGQLYLQNGLWQGAQIVPEAWVDAATSYQVSNGDDANSDWAQGYGYQFWRCRHNAYRGDGAFGQYCIVMPEQDAVLAMTAGIDLLEMQQPLDFVWDILLPAMRPDPLPDDGAAQAELSQKLATVTLPPVQGQAASPVMTQVSGRTYAVGDNALAIETLTLSFTGDGCVFSIKTATGEETIPFGYGRWQQGQPTALFRHPLLFDRTAIASSGAWTADDVYTMVVQLIETPFNHTLTCHFVRDELLIEVQVNVSLESTKPVVLLGRSAKQGLNVNASGE